ncbi:undecaprenyl-diphosphatase [Branchiibius hedensis]|uniref:Undecaprenyl-diphosphatase n=1 Tax=Branchiibius hedensis TaxID=672460 RepID=A0A2Y8ZYZ5_9MICO|nr:phosphatase PAP2 family protein [Branchiibius hedensis]PWJ26648.1 undecaprenyl-diphosphatase [Branchiibius hedensis]SSA35459.1 undecaprenyl-diphosphatase [Branchiibius hedensis]
MPSRRRDVRHHTTALGIIIGAVVLFVLLAIQVRTNTGLVHLDRRIEDAVDAARTPSLTTIAHAVTNLGRVSVVAVLAAAAAALLMAIRRDYLGPLALGLSLGVTGLTVTVVKHLVRRSRPPVAEMLGAPPNSFSFPSGHSAGSAVFLGVLTLLLLRTIRHRLARAAIVAGAVVLALGVGWSRVYLGFHWTSDVIGGWLVATAVLTLTAVAITASGGRFTERRQ